MEKNVGFSLIIEPDSFGSLGIFFCKDPFAVVDVFSHVSHVSGVARLGFQAGHWRTLRKHCFNCNPPTRWQTKWMLKSRTKFMRYCVEVVRTF